MQSYSIGFAKAYNLRWESFARQVGLRIREYYKERADGLTEILDLCCGTGQLARLFLEGGYRVTGIDLSDAMLAYAKNNNASYVSSGQAIFIRADATDFNIHRQVGLVVSTYDALNHLPDIGALKRCFARVFATLNDGGVFIFDLNTRMGLKRWNSVSVEDREDIMVVTRGVFDGVGNRAHTLLSGFIRREDGLYERFEEAVFNTVYDLDEVRQALLASGFNDSYCAQIQELNRRLENPESEGRVFVVATKLGVAL